MLHYVCALSFLFFSSLSFSFTREEEHAARLVVKELQRKGLVGEGQPVNIGIKRAGSEPHRMLNHDVPVYLVEINGSVYSVGIRDNGNVNSIPYEVAEPGGLPLGGTQTDNSGPIAAARQNLSIRGGGESARVVGLAVYALRTNEVWEINLNGTQYRAETYPTPGKTTQIVSIDEKAAPPPPPRSSAIYQQPTVVERDAAIKAAREKASEVLGKELTTAAYAGILKPEPGQPARDSNGKITHVVDVKVGSGWQRLLVTTDSPGLTLQNRNKAFKGVSKVSQPIARGECDVGRDEVDRVLFYTSE